MFTVQFVKEAAWISEDESTQADCVVKFAEFDEEMPFTAVADDIYDHSEVILEAIKSGEAGPVKSYANWKAEQDAGIEEYRAELISKITAKRPGISLPGDADTDGDGQASIEELITLLALINKQDSEAEDAALAEKYGV
jgi:hypothetical protein